MFSYVNSIVKADALKKIIFLSLILQIFPSLCFADHQECTTSTYTAYDPSGSWDELTGTYTRTETKSTKTVVTCYMVPDTPQSPAYSGGGGTPERPQMPRPPYCDTLSTDLQACRQDKFEAYKKATKNCGTTATVGGSTTVAGGIGASLSRLNVYTRVISAVVAVVAGGVTENASTNCYNGPSITKEEGLAQCDADFNTKSQTCAQFK